MSLSTMLSPTTVETQADAAHLVSPQLSIIIPSFRDERILEAIASTRLFDDLGVVKLIVIDGGSPPSLVAAIREVLAPQDVLISERDRGIFDGLNKGLDLVDTPYLGWIGSDDMFSGELKASDVVRGLQAADIFIASMAFFRGDRLRRVTHSWPASKRLGYYGLHNPHYSTFGRSELLKSVRFEIDDPISDQIYFFRVFDRRPRVAATPVVGVLAGEGGFSNSSYKTALRLNGLLFKAYRARGNLLSAIVGLATKVTYKLVMRIYFKVRVVRWPDRFPKAWSAMQASLSARGGLERQG